MERAQAALMEPTVCPGLKYMTHHLFLTTIIMPIFQVEKQGLRKVGGEVGEPVCEQRLTALGVAVFF